MSKIATFFKGLIRRVKNMGEFWLATGILFIPFGFWLMVEYPQNKMLGAIAVGVGLVCWFAAWWMIRTKEKKERQERIESHKVLEAILGELKKANENKNETA
jgi:hypothetical protein